MRVLGRSLADFGLDDEAVRRGIARPGTQAFDNLGAHAITASHFHGFGLKAARHFDEDDLTAFHCLHCASRHGHGRLGFA